MDIEERFKKFSDEYLNFEKVENKRSNRPDLHAFLLLEELSPGGKGNMICDGEYNKIWLDVDYDDLDTFTDDQILELTRCGVRCDDCGLFMFV